MNTIATTSERSRGLIILGTHGDEIEEAQSVISELQAAYGQMCDCIVGNERAVSKKVRFVEKDINRSASIFVPAEDAYYEVKRACELVRIGNSYPFVIDLHTTTADCDGCFTLIPNPSAKNLLLASALEPERIVLWAANSSREAGPPTQFMNNAVEIEFGPRCNLEGIMRDMRRCLEPIFRTSPQPSFEKLNTKKIYRVYGSLGTEENSLQSAPSLGDFQEATIEGKKCFPLLTGQYLAHGILCYLMEEIRIKKDDLHCSDQALWQRFAY